MSEFITINVFGDEFSLTAAASPPPGATLLLGPDAQRPPAGVYARLYWATDTKRLYVDDGTSWDLMSSLRHVDLLGLGSDDHPSYLPLSGVRAMIGHLELVLGTPQAASHAVPKSYADALIAGNRPFQWGLGFVSGTISTGAIFANTPVSSVFSGAKLLGWIVSARSVGTSTTATVINLSRNGAQISTISITSSSPLVQESLLNPPITLATGDRLSASVSSAPTSGQPSGVGIWVFGRI